MSSQAGNWKGKNIAEKMRYNKIIDLLEHGKPVFSTSTVPNGSLDELTYIADADYDAVIIEPREAAPHINGIVTPDLTDDEARALTQVSASGHPL